MWLRSCVVLWASALSLAGCKFDPPADVEWDAGPPDAAACDADVCTECAAGDQPVEADRCPAERPICDTTGACRGCTAHQDCGSGACSLDTGTCVDETDVAYVEASASASNALCTRSAPCNTISKGLTTGRAYVVLTPGSYVEDVSITDQTVSVIGYGASLSAQTNGVYALDVFGITDIVSIFGLRIHDSAGGVNCVSDNTLSTLGISFSDVTVEHCGLKGGLFADRCDVHMRRSRVLDNSPYGIALSRAGYDMGAARSRRASTGAISIT